MSAPDCSLYWACYQGQKNSVMKLINYKSVRYVDPFLGDTPLHQACRQGWLDIVKLFIEKYEQHVNPLLRDKIDLEPLDYALNNNKTDIAVYICQQCITSDELLNPNRIKTTVNLIESILKADPFDPKWKTANGGNILQLVGSSKSCILRMPSAVVLKILNTGGFKNIAFQPDWRTGDGDKLLELVCQSETYLSHTSSALILKWLDVVTIDHVKLSIPDSKTADGKTLIQLVCHSQICIAHVSTTVLSKWLRDSTSLSLEGIFVLPARKTADGDTLLQLICQSEMIVSQISSAVLLKWLEDTTLDINLAKIIIPEWKTADGDTLLQLVIQSEMIVSQMSSAVLSKWLKDVTLDINLAKIIIPEWKTADGDTLLQLVIQSEMIVSQMSSAVLSKWLKDVTLDINLAKIIIPEWKTADGDTLLQLVFQSEMIVSQMSSAVLSKWLKDATLDINLAKLTIPEWKTADGNTLLQLVFQSETIVSQISSPVLSKWLEDTTLDVNLAKIIIPGWKTADGDTLLQLVCQSAKSMSTVLLKWLSDFSEIPTDECMTLPEWKTADGDTLLQLVCQSEIYLSRVPSTLLLKCLSNNALYLPSIIIVPTWKTADGDTLLKLLCQSEMCLSHIPTVILLKWLILYGIPLDQGGASAVFQPNWRTADGNSFLQLVCQSKACLSQISSTVILKWLNTTTVDLAKISTLDYKTADGETLLQLVCRSETIMTRISSAVLSKWLEDATLDTNLVKIIIPEWKTADGDTLLQLVLQSETVVSRISSPVLLKWSEDTTLIDINLVPEWKTADGDTLLQLVLQSETVVSRISSPVLLKWLEDTTLIDINLVPEWKTADGDTLLQLVFQSEMMVSQMSSAVLSKWLEDATLDTNLVKIIIPKWKTADGDTLLQLVLQSETVVSRISSPVLLKWLEDTTLIDINLVPEWKTADGDTLFQLVFQSEMSQISSTVLSKWLQNTTIDINLAKIIIPEWKTADGDTLLQLVFQSETIVSRISSPVLSKWLEDTTLDVTLAKIIIPEWKTADGDTLLQLVCQSAMSMSTILSKWLSDFSEISTDECMTLQTGDGYTLLQLVCQSEIYLSRVPSTLLLKCLSNNTLYLPSIIIVPTWKTADGDTLLQLVLQSETVVSRISSPVLLKWLEDTTLIDINLVLEWKTADGDTLLQLAFQSEMLQISSTVLSKWLQNTTIDINLAKIIIPEWKTADGDTFLQLIVLSETIVSRISSPVLSKLLEDTTLDINLAKIIIPEWKTADGDTLLQLIFQSETIVSRISLPVLSKLLKGTTFDVNLAKIIIPEWKTANGDSLLQLVFEISTNQMKMVDPNRKTLDGDHFLYAICQSTTDDKRLIKLMQCCIKEDPGILDSNGNTALHIACQADKPALVALLLDEAKCDPSIKDKKKNLPLDMTTNPKVINYLCQHDQVAVFSETIAQWMYNRSIDDTKMLCILKALVNNHRCRTNDGSTLLHITCYAYGMFRDKIRLIHYLLTEGHCDPNSLDNKGQMPLQLTSDSKIMKLLIEHGAKMTTDVVFKVISSRHISHSSAIELFTLSTKKGMMLWNTHDLNSSDETALHLACKRDKPAIVNYLLTEAKCDPNANDRYQCPPLESTTNFEIAKMLIEHGARVTPKIVLRFEAMEVINNDYKVIQLMLTTCSWSPDDKDSDGYTALHLACKAGSPTTVNRLLSVAHCDPNIKSNNEKVPLQITTNPEIIKDLIRHGAKTSIMYESCQNSLGTNEPVKPPVKVFVVGNPSVGKSSLTAILKKRLNIVARLFTSGKVSGVDQKTVGIVPHEVESDIYGRVTLYDFAGHREFYSGHAALLQTAIQSTPPVFLLVVNLYQDDHAITNDVMYWISFLENQCASVNCKPHVILVGSHADSLKSSGINAKDKIKAIVDSLDTKCFMNMKLVGFVAMDCQYHQSSGMSNLRSLLIKSCNELRIHEPITFNAHCFLVYLIDTFKNSSAVMINTIYKDIKYQWMFQTEESLLEFLPRNCEALYKVCLELNDRGHILLLKDRIAVENSYIIIDKEFLLSKISGTVFAPEGFKQYKQLSTNTGVVSLSRIAECFPDKDLNILTGFLTHLEFCHEISDQALHQLISEQYSRVSGEHYYLFPGLISIKADDTVWKLQSKYDYNFGWILKCIHLEQFFSSRFLQVLLLRLAFSFALETCDNPNQSIGIHRNCYLWKNGIFWGSGFRMQTLVEVTPDNKSVIVLARFRKVKLLQCVQHRSNVINTILQCKKQFCPRVLTTESFVDSSSSLQYPINMLANELTICTLQDLATAVVNESSVVLQCDEIDAENFLSFEPYLEMKSSTIHELWDEKNEKKVISERFLSTFAEQASEKLTLIIGILIGNSASSTRDDQLYQILLKWRDGDMNNQKTYRDLRQIVDQYSVFAGRNVLVSTDWSIMYAIA